MPQLLDRFIDLNVRFEKMSRKEKEVKHKKYIDFIIKEAVTKLGDDTDYLVDGFVASIAVIISYSKKFTTDEYKKLQSLTSTFAVLPSFKEYKKIIVNLQSNTEKVIKTFFTSISSHKGKLDERFTPWCIEFLATLNGDIEFLMMYTKLFKR
ncbi:MAG: hypothetical protein R3Y60_05265 [bacterium]